MKMENQIKIKHTEKYGNHIVCRGTLVLVEDNLSTKFGEYETVNGKLPFIISEPEDIEEGEMCFYCQGDGTGKLKQWIAPFVKNSAGAKYKILASPENLMPEVFQWIMDAKLKEGKEVKIQCEIKAFDSDGKPIPYAVEKGDYTVTQIKFFDNRINILAFMYSRAFVQIDDIDGLLIQPKEKPKSDNEKEGWGEIENEFRKYRQSLDGIETISAYTFFLKQNYNLPTKK